MHTVWSRVNAIFFYGATALFALSVASAVTTLWLPPVYEVSTLQVNQLKTLRAQVEDLRNGRSARRDRAVLTFDLDTDLSGVFNWNVKQLFVYITASFATTANARNEVVVWDKIVTQPEDAVLKLGGSFAKYPIIDQHTDLRGRVLNLTLHWDVMPYTGIMYFGASEVHSVRLPADYCTDAACSFEVQR